jgi:hypothetical protein
MLEAIGISLIGPVLIGGFIVLIPIVGAFLAPAARAWIERAIFGPLLLIYGAALIVLAFEQPSWTSALPFAGLAVIAAWQAIRTMRRTHPKPPVGAVAGTGT